MKIRSSAPTSFAISNLLKIPSVKTWFRSACFLFALLPLTFVSACNDSEVTSPGKVTSTSNADRNENVLNLSSQAIVSKSEQSPYHYYFSEEEAVNSFYSRKRGYLNETDAKRHAERPVIEIQSDPGTEKVIRVYYKMDGLPSLNVTTKDVKSMLDFVSMFDNEASSIFQRNFKTIFHYSPSGPDSNHYYNKAEGFSIAIDHNLDIVKEEKLSPDRAYIQASITPY